MAKKRVVKRTTRRSTRSRARRVSNSSRNSKRNGSINAVSIKRKSKIVLKNLILFGVIFLLSVLLYNLSGSNQLLGDFFWFLSLISGFVFVAFVIAFLVLFFLKAFK